MTAQDAGAKLREKRKMLGLTMATIVKSSTVPSTSYLAGLEAGRISVGRSKHLPSLAEVLKLSDAEVAQMTGKVALEGHADIHQAMDFQTRVMGDVTKQEGNSDPRQARHLNMATVLAGYWRRDAVGAYTLDANPHEVVVVDPQQCELEVGGHYLVLDHQQHVIVRTVCIQVGDTPEVLHDHVVVPKEAAKVIGRILWEAREL